MKKQIKQVKIRKASEETSKNLKFIAEIFFERNVKKSQQITAIYSNESILILNKFINENVFKWTEDEKRTYIFLIGTFLGQYVVNEFHGEWYFDRDERTVPYNGLVSITHSKFRYYDPYSCVIRRIYMGERDAINKDIEIIETTSKNQIVTTEHNNL